MAWTGLSDSGRFASAAALLAPQRLSGFHLSPPGRLIGTRLPGRLADAKTERHQVS